MDTSQNLPNFSVPLVDTERGTITQPWMRLFLNLWNRTGGAVPVTPGGGTVTAVSASGTQGVTASVTDPNTTPNVIIGLGAISPSSVAATGTVTGSNLSGTNTGDQTITLTGAVTGSGTGSFATTLSAGQAASNVGTLGGDLSGTLPNPTVAKIQAIPVKSGTPTDGQLLTYVGANSDWEAKTLSNVALLNAANTFTTGAQTIQTGAAATNGMIVKLASSQSADGILIKDNGNNALSGFDSSGNIVTESAGVGIKIQEGTNARMGTAILSGGAITINNTSITANTRIFLTTNEGALSNVGFVYDADRIPGTNFTIKSSNASDTSNVAWLLIEPSPVTYPAGGLPTRSLQYTAASSMNLSMTPANWGYANVNRSLFAISFWYKRASAGADMTVFQIGDIGNNTIAFTMIFDSSNHIDIFNSVNGSSVNGYYITTATYTDTASWHNVLIYFDANNVTSSQRIRLWHDGIEVTSFGTQNTVTGPAFASPGVGLNVIWGDAISGGGNSQFYNGKLFQPTFYNGFLPSIGSVYSGGHPVDVTTLGVFSLLNTNVSDAITKDYVISTAWTNTNTVVKSTDIPT